MGKVKDNPNRIKGAFAWLPHAVLQSREYRDLPHAAKWLLLLMAAGYRGHNNGKLVATPKFLRKWGWYSADSTVRCVRLLLDSRLLVQTRLGMRPNRAAWYAISWRPLDYDQLMEIRREDFQVFHGTALTPMVGKARAPIAPMVGKGKPVSSPMTGAIQGGQAPSLTPTTGKYLDQAICIAPSAGPNGKSRKRTAATRAPIGDPT